MMTGIKIPQSLTICGHQIDVQVMRLNDAKGEAYPGELSIKVEEDLPTTLKLEVLLHETLHFADEFYKIFDEGKAERQIDQIANFMYQLLTQNHELAQVFLSEGFEAG